MLNGGVFCYKKEYSFTLLNSLQDKVLSTV